MEQDKQAVSAQSATPKRLPHSRGETIKAVVAAALIVACAVIPVFFLLRDSYSWHICQPETWQGGLVALAFAGLSWLAGRFLPKGGFVAVLALGGFYLVMNGVILPFLLAYVYMEALHLTGFALLSLSRRAGNASCITCFLAGISVWGVCGILLSLLGIGSFWHLRIMTLVLAVVALAVAFKKKPVFLATRFYRLFGQVKQSRVGLLLLLVLCMVVLIQMAKSNTAIDYDSLWYGLRPEYVLMGEHSFYEDLGLTSFVMYYPKLTEFLFLPLSNLGDYSFIILGNCFVLIFLAAALWRICRRLFGWGSTGALAAAAIAACIPAVACAASSARPDLLGNLLVLCAWMYLYEYLRTKAPRALVLGVLSLALCTGTKPTYIMWGGLLFVCFLVPLCLLWRKKEHRPTRAGWRALRPELAAGGLGILLVLGIHWRTFKLTGFPLYPILLSAFTKLGFTAHYPHLSEYNVGVNMPQSFGEVLQRWRFFFFQPTQLAAITIMWTSNMLLCLLVLWVLYYRKKAAPRDKSKLPVTVFRLCTCLSFLALTLYYVGVQELPSGNYFICPVLLVSLHLAEVLFSPEKGLVRVPKAVSVVLCTVLLVTQLPTMMVSHFSWAWGTKTLQPFVQKDNFESPKVNQRYYDQLGYGVINAWLAQNPTDGLILSSFPDISVIGRLHGPVVSCLEIGQYGGINHLADYDSFIRYIDYAQPAAFLLENNVELEFSSMCMEYLAQNGYKDIVQDKAATLYIL